MTEEIFGKLKGRIDLNACTPIYDPAHLGGIHLANVVGGKLLAGLEDEVRRCRTSMTRARDDYAGVKQKMSELYFGPADDKTQFLKVDNFPFMRALGYAYLEVVYNPLGALKGYSPLETLSSVGLHWYGPNEGISFHRDYSHDRNLIGIFTLLGAGKFSVASKIPVNEGLFKAAIGNLIISAVVSDIVGIKFVIRKIA